MRLLCPIFSASVVVLWKTAQSTTTTSADHTNGAAHDFTISLRPTLDASNTPKLLGPHDSAIDEIDPHSPNSEEKGLNPLYFLSNAFNALRTRPWTRLQHPATVFKHFREPAETTKSIHHGELIRLIRYVDVYNARGYEFSDDDVVELLTSVRTKEELVAFFHALRYLPDMKDRADALQRALAKTLPKPVVLNFSVWLKSRLTPEEVFPLMPIGAWTGLPRDIKEEARKNINCFDLNLWLNYIDKFNDGGDAYDEHAVVELLTKYIEVDELVTVFHSLRDAMHRHSVTRSYANYRADDLQRALATKYPDTVNLMIPLWLKAEVIPEDVYYMMAVAEEIYTGGLRDRRTWFNIREKLGQWRGYADKFCRQERDKKRSGLRNAIKQTSFSETPFNPEYFLIQQLVLYSEVEDLVAFVHYLGSERPRVFDASEMQKILFAANQPGTSSMFLSQMYLPTLEELTFKLWTDLGLSPDMAYESMPIAWVGVFELSPNKAIEGWTDLSLDQWLRYVAHFRARDSYDGSYDDKKVIEKLRQRRSAEVLKDSLERFRDCPGMKKRADELLSAFRDLYMKGAEHSLTSETLRK